MKKRGQMYLHKNSAIYILEKNKNKQTNKQTHKQTTQQTNKQSKTKQKQKQNINQTKQNRITFSLLQSVPL